MNGYMDDHSRAFVSVNVRANRGVDPEASVDTWIDTSFDGHFVFPNDLIIELGLDTLAETEAILADGSKVVLQTYVCYLDWFGEQMPVQVVGSEARFPLLGTLLMADLRLVVNYPSKTVKLIKAE